MNLAIIAAIGRNRAIGCHNRLPWFLPEDLAHFKALTMGHPIIMGRNTYESLPHGALPGRRNLVVSTTIRSLPDAEVFGSLELVLRACNCGLPPEKQMRQVEPDSSMPFVIGGASLYRQTMHLASVLHITLVEDKPADADAFFPPIDPSQWEETKKEKHHGFSFITYQSRRQD